MYVPMQRADSHTVVELQFDERGHVSYVAGTGLKRVFPFTTTIRALTSLL